MTPEELMQAAIDVARKGIAAGQSPFGCAIALDGKVIAASHNTVLATPDATAHAETNAIREACLALGSHFLTGAIVATTCEPCPMCMTALHWARVDTVYFGATIADATAAGFNEVNLPAAEVARAGGDKVRLVSGFMRDECRALFDEWKQRSDAVTY